MRLALLLSLSFLLVAQDVSLRSTSNLVLAPLSVNDKQGRPVDGLDAKDFLVYDDDAPVLIETEDSTQPLSIALVVQNTLSAQSVLDKLRKTTSVIGPLITGARGEASVVTFGDQVRIAQEFTRDSAKIENTLRGLDGSGEGGRLLDGLATALHLLDQRKRDRRRIILLLSEKHDRSSEETIDTLIRRLEHSNTTVYSLTFSPTRTMFANRAPKHCDRKCRDCANTCRNCGSHCDRENPAAVPSNTATGGLMNIVALFGEMKRAGQPDIPAVLASLSGGTASAFVRKQSLEDALRRIGADLHEQYLVTFPMRRQSPGVFHRIRASIKGRPDLTVRTRVGYVELGDE